MVRLRQWQTKINIKGTLRADEPLAPHTTFRVGGPADLYAVPRDEEDLVLLIRAARSDGIPTFVLGGGANILVSDRGIRGLVIDMREFAKIEHTGTLLTAGAGAAISDASAYAADHELAGLDFIYAMPGSVGGAVWMNARCYDGEIFPILESVNVVTADGQRETYLPRAQDFSYKRSPFMINSSTMTSVRFSLADGSKEKLWQKMREHERDRWAKGHFAAPCAGSIFKNNRAFGRPSGAIIDSIGLRGYAIGGAKVSDQHANIVINAHEATASEIRALVEHVHDEVLSRLGLDLEREVIYVGDWEER
ncbi:MAG: UDP-N-acetylmuramate dehydrogenase [Spirochaetales bacterium]